MAICITCGKAKAAFLSKECNQCMNYNTRPKRDAPAASSEATQSAAVRDAQSSDESVEDASSSERSDEDSKGVVECFKGASRRMTFCPIDRDLLDEVREIAKSAKLRTTALSNSQAQRLKVALEEHGFIVRETTVGTPGKGKHERPVGTPNSVQSSRPKFDSEGVVEAEGDEKECPFCAEFIKRKARVCKHCGRDLPHMEASVLAGIAQEQEKKVPCKQCGNMILQRTASRTGGYCMRHAPASTGIGRAGGAAGSQVGCRECHKNVAASADTCPHCGATNPGLSQTAQIWVWIIGAVVMVWFWFYGWDLLINFMAP